jgi:glycosyltransferase involved in cell wall biosynthesis
MAPQAANPRITVIIATRSRPASLRRCVDSILLSDHDSFDVIVVDQSDEPATLADDPRLEYHHSSTRGKSAALNVGIAAATGELCAFTDDDCTVSPDWLTRAEALFVGHPEVAFAFGDLEAVAHDPRTSFVPIATMGRFEVVQGTHALSKRGGAGADMLARRSLFDSIGGFDEEIGPGSRFAACEEFDVYYRVLAGGYAVARDPELEVTHWGIRDYGDGSAQTLELGYQYGEGVVLGKHLRLGDVHMIRPAASIIVRTVERYVRATLARRADDRHSAATLLRGVLSGLTARVDRHRRVFEAS